MTESPVTFRQIEVLLFVRQFHLARGFMPTRVEIANGMGMKSENAAHDHLVALERKGMVTKQRGMARSIGLTPAALQLLNAASPLAAEHAPDLIALPVVDMARVNLLAKRSSA